MKATIIALILTAFLFVGCSNDVPELDKKDYKIVQIEDHAYIIYEDVIIHDGGCNQYGILEFIILIYVCMIFLAIVGKDCKCKCK